jgi:hypothetical protein
MSLVRSVLRPLGIGIGASAVWAQLPSPTPPLTVSFPLTEPPSATILRRIRGSPSYCSNRHVHNILSPRGPFNSRIVVFHDHLDVSPWPPVLHTPATLPRRLRVNVRDGNARLSRLFTYRMLLLCCCMVSILLCHKVWDLDLALCGGGDTGCHQSDIWHQVVGKCNVGVVNVPVTMSAVEWTDGRGRARVNDGARRARHADELSRRELHSRACECVHPQDGAPPTLPDWPAPSSITPLAHSKAVRPCLLRAHSLERA